jgi:hypothetical protein
MIHTTHPEHRVGLIRASPSFVRASYFSSFQSDSLIRLSGHFEVCLHGREKVVRHRARGDSTPTKSGLFQEANRPRVLEGLVVRRFDDGNQRDDHPRQKAEATRENAPDGP